jgi:hypothetical protein
MDLSAGTLFASLVVSTVGFGIFVYGKKQERIPQLSIGLVMAVFPYFTAGPLVLWGIGAALILGLVLALRLGM